jgi:hypothetical protein
VRNGLKDEPGDYPCSVCRRNVENNSVECVVCNKFAHKHDWKHLRIKVLRGHYCHHYTFDTYYTHGFLHHRLCHSKYCLFASALSNLTLSHLSYLILSNLSFSAPFCSCGKNAALVASFLIALHTNWSSLELALYQTWHNLRSPLPV